METGLTVKMLKALADEKRLQIMQHLSRRSVCVCEMESLLSLSQPAVSHHVKVLREAGLITHTRQGKWVFYSLDREQFASFLQSLNLLAVKDAGDSGPPPVPEVCKEC
ncbi:MAG: metalloregulator ArsR/SmtB family transcription factor [Bacillota bacterium]|nr:metalloregulator ArsR/SmtB family transcription factor [Bacillota bacterium]MDW7683072.1 metalloregulator ArsR/SmtB family transcription factor [Bacillota bacterium]